MRRDLFHLGRAWRLTPLAGPTEGTISHLEITDSTKLHNLLLPLAPALGYFVIPARGVELGFGTEEFGVERLDLARSIWIRLRLALLFKKKKYLEFGSFALFSFGQKPERKRFTRFNQYMADMGVVLDGDFVARHPELVRGWPSGDQSTIGASEPAQDGKAAFAVIAHIYYEDTWPDLAGALKTIELPFDLIVTTVSGRERLIEIVKGDFPQAEIRVLENRGRDVRPFLLLLEEGRFDRYLCVCKVHGKKSTDGGRMPYIGALWRRRLLVDLVAAPGLAARVVETFRRDPSVGMIGPAIFRLPGKAASDKLSWAENRPLVFELAARMGVPADEFRLDFFAGTMFWVRPKALNPLRDLRLSGTFAPERGLLDGGLEHAVERLFATSVVLAGYRLVNNDDPALERQPTSAPGPQEALVRGTFSD